MYELNLAILRDLHAIASKQRQSPLKTQTLLMVRDIPFASSIVLNGTAGALFLDQQVGARFAITPQRDHNHML